MRAFLLCCGPSVKYQNLQCLKGEYCFSVSNFFVHPLIEEINPVYHLMPPIHPPITQEMALCWFSEADKKLPKNTKLLLCRDDVNLWKQLESERDAELYIPHQIQYQSVSQIALAMMLHLIPFEPNSELYLLGCDHNWIRHVKQTRHFYDSSESVVERMGYNEWFGSSNKEEAVNIERNSLANLDRIYSLYNEVATNKQIRIWNATPHSSIKVYPFTDLFNIFEEPTMDK